MLNVWLSANYSIISVRVQDRCPDVMRSLLLTTTMSSNIGEKRGGGKYAATVPPTCAAYIFPPGGSAGLILPTAVPVNRSSLLQDSPGLSVVFTWHLSKGPGRDGDRRSVNAPRQSVCSGSSSPCDAPVCLPVWTRQCRRRGGLFVRRNITSTTAAWREQTNKGETRLRESWLDRSLLWVRTSVLIPMSEMSKRAK